MEEVLGYVILEWPQTVQCLLVAGARDLVPPYRGLAHVSPLAGKDVAAPKAELFALRSGEGHRRHVAQVKAVPLHVRVPKVRHVPAARAGTFGNHLAQLHFKAGAKGLELPGDWHFTGSCHTNGFPSHAIPIQRENQGRPSYLGGPDSIRRGTHSTRCCGEHINPICPATRSSRRHPHAITGGLKDLLQLGVRVFEGAFGLPPHRGFLQQTAVAGRELESSSSLSPSDATVKSWHPERPQRFRRRLVAAIGEMEGTGGSLVIARLSEIDAEIARQQSKLDDVDRRMHGLAEATENASTAVGLLERFDDVWNAMVPEERVDVVHLLVNSVRVDPAAGKLELHLHDLADPLPPVSELAQQMEVAS